MTMWQMYWLTRLDGINKLTIGLFILCLVVCFFSLLICTEASESFAKKSIKFVTLPSLAIGAIILISNAFIPTTKQMAAILIVPKIVNNQKVQEIPDKMLSLATEWLEELRPKSTKE